MPNRRRIAPLPLDLDAAEPTPTAQPRERPLFGGEEDDRLVPVENVGGAAPTALGGDSGGDLPGPEDDLSNLVEQEPPESPEVGAVHVRADEGPKAPRR